MQRLKENLPFIAAVVIFIAVCVAAYYLVVVRKVDYYTQIKNAEVNKISELEYEYQLRAYDEHGKIRDVEFKAHKELRKDAFLKLEVMSWRGVVGWEEVQYDELPYDVKARYQDPETLKLP